MQQFADWLITKIPHPASLPTEFLYAGIQLVFALLMLMLFVAPFAGIISFIERRIAARMMDRVGPNRVGPQGFFQWIADGIKSLLKEDIIPTAADPVLFRLGPYLVFVGMFAAFVSIPFSSGPNFESGEGPTMRCVQAIGRPAVSRPALNLLYVAGR